MKPSREVVEAMLLRQCIPQHKWNYCVERAGRLCPGCNQEISWICPEVTICLTCRELPCKECAQPIGWSSSVDYCNNCCQTDWESQQTN